MLSLIVRRLDVVDDVIACRRKLVSGESSFEGCGGNNVGSCCRRYFTIFEAWSAPVDVYLSRQVRREALRISRDLMVRSWHVRFVRDKFTLIVQHTLRRVSRLPRVAVDAVQFKLCLR